MTSEPQDFALQPFQEKARPEASPRLMDEDEGLDESYPAGGAASEVADGGVPRRKKRNTARLVWDSKPRRAPNPKNLGFQIAEVVVPNPATQAGPRLPFDPGTQEVDTSSCNRLIWGDNLLVMQALLAQGYEGKINLIYIDPPFDSKADYSHSVQLTPDEAGKGGEELNAEMSALERLAYRDTWEDGTDSYLDMLYPRLQMMHRLLAEDGSLFVHIGWQVHAHVKCLLDEVFGRSSFRNDIVWQRFNFHADANRFGIVHENLLFYSKSENYHFTKMYEPVADSLIESHFTGRDPDGRVFTLDNPTAPAHGKTGRPILLDGKELYPPAGAMWRWKQENFDRLWDEGKIVLTDTGFPRVKRYLDEIEGTAVHSLWTDLRAINSQSNERVDYATQKPEALLERILHAVTVPGDLVADFFCGSGTTAAVAEKHGRRWITSDLGKASIQVSRNRFVKLGEAGSGGIAFQRPDGATRCAPFVVENLGNYQRQLIYLNDTRLRQVGPLILTLYGAQPHPTERGLGTQSFNDAETGRFQRRLVLVGEPDRPLSAKRVAEAAWSLKTLDGGGYAKLVALGWDFELNFDSALDKHLGPDWHRAVEVRQIPTEVIEYLKKMPADASPDDPAVEKLRQQVAFFEKPFLAPPELTVLGWTSELEPRLRVRLALSRYTLRGLPMGLQGKKLSEDEARALIQKAGGPTGLNLVDFWSVDDFFGGEDSRRPFTSTWQALRGLGKRVRPVATETELVYVPRPGRRVALRLVDLFGNDALWTGLLPEG
jgi:adenine-specific DNA-methyltransferase